MKSAINYLFIGVIYSIFKIQHVDINLNYIFCIQLLAISIFSVVFGLMFSGKTPINNTFFIGYNKANIVYYAKYVGPVIICLLIWKLFQIKEPQWLIWSSLSVFNIDFDQAKNKIHNRIYAGTTGIIVGIILLQIIPFNSLLSYGYYTIILISLKGFNDYKISFIIRCTFIILLANHNFMTTWQYRIEDIIIGGSIGLILSWLFSNYTNQSTFKQFS